MMQHDLWPATPAGSGALGDDWDGLPRAHRMLRHALAVGLVLAVLSLTAGAWLAAEHFGQRRMREAEANGLARAAGTAAAAEQLVLRAMVMTQITLDMAQRWAAAAAGYDDDAAEAIAQGIRGIVANPDALIHGVSILGADGLVQWSSEDMPPGLSAVDRDYFHAQDQPGARTFAGGPIHLRSSGAPAIPVSQRIEGAGRQVATVAVVMLPPGAISSALAAIARGPGDFAAVFSADGRLLARSSRAGELLGRPLPTVSTAARIRLENAGEMRLHWPITNRDQMLAWHRIEPLGLTVLAGLDPQELTARAETHRLALRGGAATVSGLALGGLLIGGVHRSRRKALLRATIDRASLGRLEAIHRELPAIIFVRRVLADGETQLVHRGGNVGLVTGWPTAEVATANLFALAEPGAPIEASFRAVIEHGSGTFQWRSRTAEGTWRDLRSFARVLVRYPDGAVMVAGLTLDVTTEVSAQLRLRAMERLTALGEFAVSLGHEMNQPLQAILLAAEGGRIGGDAMPRQRLYGILDSIAAQCLRAVDIMRNLRRFATGADDGTAPGPVVLADAVAAVRALVETALAEATIALEVRVALPSPVAIARRVTLEQVLLNLIANARDALLDRPPGAERRITIAGSGDAAQTRIVVADTGGGIAPEVIGRIFEPLVTTKGPDRGTGLGLSICHGLVREMGGDIRAWNAAEGAVFEIALPAGALQAA